MFQLVTTTTRAEMNIAPVNRAFTFILFLVFVRRWQRLLHKNIVPPQDDDFEISVIICSVMCETKELYVYVNFSSLKKIKLVYMEEEKLFGNGESFKT